MQIVTLSTFNPCFWGFFCPPRLWSTDHWKGYPHQKCAWEPGSQPRPAKKDEVWVGTVGKGGAWGLAFVSVCYVPCLGEGSQTHLIHCNLVTQAVILTPMVYGVRGRDSESLSNQPPSKQLSRKRAGIQTSGYPNCYGLNCVPQIHTLKPLHTNVCVFGDRACRR